VNTLFLMTALGVAAWAWRRPGVRLAAQAASLQILLAFVGLLLVSAAGAVTALGDTLYPVAAHGDALGGAHFLQQLRIVHPVAAGVVAVYVIYVVLSQAGERLSTRRWAQTVVALVGLQVLAGFVNIWLNAPGYLQILHLALANLLWLALVFFGLERLTAEGRVVSP
jgi:heme A synthase